MTDPDPPTPPQELLEAARELKNFLDRTLTSAHQYTKSFNEETIRSHARGSGNIALWEVTEAFLIAYAFHRPSIGAVVEILQRGRDHARDIMNSLVANDLLGTIDLPFPHWATNPDEPALYHRLHAYTPYFPPGDEANVVYSRARKADPTEAQGYTNVYSRGSYRAGVPVTDQPADPPTVPSPRHRSILDKLLSSRWIRRLLLGKGSRRPEPPAESDYNYSIDNATADINTILNYLGPPPESMGQEQPEPTPSPAGAR